MSDKEFRALLDWFMVSDPWPLDEFAHKTIQTMLDLESVRRGFPTWVDAYHYHKGE